MKPELIASQLANWQITPFLLSPFLLILFLPFPFTLDRLPNQYFAGCPGFVLVIFKNCRMSSLLLARSSLRRYIIWPLR